MRDSNGYSILQAEETTILGARGLHKTLTNTFHNTSVQVTSKTYKTYMEYGCDALPRTTQRRIKEKLCGSNTCTCGTVRN